MKKLAIFDLDGTLLNTIADLAAATNYALTQYGYPTHSTDAYRFFIGNGINKLFERALPEKNRTPDNILRIRSKFIPYYNQHNADMSCPYSGIEQLLHLLQKHRIQIAVASNKYQEATSKLIKQYFPLIHFTAVFGQRENVPTKPDPQVINEIIKLANVYKEETVYIGDSGVDMQTGLNANVTTIGVCWGFRPKNELQEFNPDYLAEEPMDIANFLQLL